MADELPPEVGLLNDLQVLSLGEYHLSGFGVLVHFVLFKLTTFALFSILLRSFVASWDGIGFTIPMEVGRLENLEFLKICTCGDLTL